MSENGTQGPINPDHEIEDPMHGPSAVRALLQIPAMPRGDGTYYQPGAFYTNGTPYINSLGRPVYIISGSTMAGMRESYEELEWREACHEGDEALVALEARRQQARLANTGFANSYQPTDICPGGKRLEDCETGSKAYRAGQEWAANNSHDKPDDGRRTTVLAWAGGTCVGCSVSCEVAVATVNGQAEETCVRFYKPDPNIKSLHISIGSLTRVADPTVLAKLQEKLGDLGKSES